VGRRERIIAKMDTKIITAIVVAVLAVGVLFLMATQVASKKAPSGDATDEHGCATTQGYSWCEVKQKCIKLSQESCTAMVGNDTDEHGCKASAGYTWCEPKQKCLRTWEESCNVVRFGKSLGDAINAKWGFPGVIYPDTNEVADEGWLRGSLNVQSNAEFQSLCAIFMRGNLTRSLDDGTTIYHHNPVTIGGKQVCEVAIQGGMAKPCGALTLNMDLESMKTGYVKSEDNWKDFFTCSPSVATDYCKGECSALMDVLMKSDRTQMVNP